MISVQTTAVILAAGSGTRLTGSEVIRPKCLAPFGSFTLIEVQMRALRAQGIEDIVVVVGYGAGRVRQACGPGVRFVENAQYLDTNSMYSMWLARPLLRGALVVMNCDVLFHPAMLRDLLTAGHENALLVSYPDPGAAPFGAEEMKVRVRRGRVDDIRKDLPLAEVDGENVGIAKFSERGAARLMEVAEEIISSGSVRDWAPRAFGTFAREQPLYAVGTRGLPWTEIDTPEDYRYASSVVFPAIEPAVHDLSPSLQWGA
ncbi:MAG: phosphocholine cytidylyltransferase family protein [Acidobacteria bacterium]|nr:phosphocholine cytidylyltransferase family protein [Acidobacteriota bacterium]